jgi:hypothetical protein
MEGVITLDCDVRGDLDLILDERTMKHGGRESRSMVANRLLRRQIKREFEEMGYKRFG